MKSRTKREMVLEIYDREAMGEVTANEIEVIQRGLLDAFGDGGAMSPAEISRVLLDEDLPVRLDQVFRMGHPFDSYEELFAGLAFAKSTVEAEESIRIIDRHHRRFIGTGDRTGVRFARQTAQRARQNALTLGNSTTRSEREKRIQLEIAQWFSIWLQTPDLFQTWLELRKRRPEYRQLAEDP
ncbi:MAG: hypothetical protein ACOYLN_12910 [Blastocatellia bacterium]|jgi:hypothetical protein